MKRKLSTLTVVLLISIFICGCTKEKAEAIKNAAEQFRSEAIAALTEIKGLFRQEVGMPVESQDKIISKMANDFGGADPIGATELDFVIEEASAANPQLKRADQELFDKLEARYNAFAAMFKSLPEGSYLAAKSVKQAEKHAVNLTADFINLAVVIDKNPFQITARRVFLLENIQKDRLVTDAGVRANLLARDAEAAYQVQQEEAQAKQRAIIACLKAAETCRTVAELIRNYKKLSASDILIMARGVLSFAAEVSGGNVDVKALLGKYTSVENAIRADPYWNAILDKPINN
jgi:hypothetical protein